MSLAAELGGKGAQPVRGSRRLAALANPRAIINRRALQARLDEIVAAGQSATARRPEVLTLFKAELAAGRDEIGRRFEAGASGPQVARAQCHLCDQVVRLLYDYATRHLYPSANPSTGERLSLVAIGGYGRGEMAPFSDLDLLFLQPYKMTPRSEQVIEEILYFLWDLGFKVGQAVRSLDDCIRLAKADHVICTSLLEARWIWGDQGLYQELRHRFRREIQHGGWADRYGIRFVQAKLDERKERHKRVGGSRYSLEPNIKEGKGGLRDLQSLYWIAKFLYDVDDIPLLADKGVFTRAEVRRFEKAHKFLWNLRCQLHYFAGRAEERLTFDLQMALAPRMGYTDHAGSRDVERFMKHYFLVAKEVGSLTRIFCAALEARQRSNARFLPSLKLRRRVAGFVLEGDRLMVKDATHFARAPIDMLRIFQVAQEEGLDIHPQTLRLITQSLKYIKGEARKDPKANKIFLDILTSPKDPEIALRRLNEAGVFGRFVPAFGRVVAQMQYNMYHHFTVDEHTIMAIGVLHAIEKGQLKDIAPIASEVVHKVNARRVLYVAVLLHDIAKGRGGDHSELGARIAEKICPRLGLSKAETETVAWLVMNHLAMSDIAFKRDIEDPQTIQTFAGLVQSPERLRLLLVLTVADIRAVGPNVWNAWKAALLRELYWRCDELLSGGMAVEKRDERIRRAKEELSLCLADWTKKDIEAHLRRGYPAYWVSCDIKTLERHARLVREAEADKRPLTVKVRADQYLQATEVTVYTADHAGLFSRIAGAMAVAGASIDAARIVTLSNGMALDSFFVEAPAGGPFDQPGKLARLAAYIEQSLDGRLKPLQALENRKGTIPSRYQVFRFPAQVLIDNKASRHHTVIEVQAPDRPGLLYRVTLALSRLNLMILSARIATYGERAVDVFYVQDPLGGKVEAPRKLKAIEKKLLESLEDDDNKTKATAKTEKPNRKASRRREKADQ